MDTKTRKQSVTPGKEDKPSVEKVFVDDSQKTKPASIHWESPTLNTVELNNEREKIKEKKTVGPPTPVEKNISENKVESDEIFTARQPAEKPTTPLEMEKQYRSDFIDKGNRFETSSNSENIAESMVRLAETRGWDEIKVAGTEAFRKEVWLEAAARGMHVKGYWPTEQDKVEILKRAGKYEATKIEKENKPTNEQETDSLHKTRANTFATGSMPEAVKKYPELIGAVAVIAAIDKKAEADGLTLDQRAVVSARVRQNIVNSIERGNIPEMKIREKIEVQPNKEKEYSR
jgi:hypothetical protein